MASAAQMADTTSSTSLALPCSSSSFSELRTLSPEFLTQDMLAEQSKMETDNPVVYTRMKSLSHLPMDISGPTTVSSQCTANQRTLDAVEHDHAFLHKRIPAVDTPSSSSEDQPNRRSSSRIQSRTTCSSSSSASSVRTKRSRNVNRAKDIETSDDLSYYLERRRKNNEASKVSRAVRKHKFENMDERW